MGDELDYGTEEAYPRTCILESKFLWVGAAMTESHLWPILHLFYMVGSDGHSLKGSFQIVQSTSSPSHPSGLNRNVEISTARLPLHSILSLLSRSLPLLPAM